MKSNKFKRKPKIDPFQIQLAITITVVCAGLLLMIYLSCRGY